MNKNQSIHLAICGMCLAVWSSDAWAVQSCGYSGVFAINNRDPLPDQPARPCGFSAIFAVNNRDPLPNQPVHGCGYSASVMLDNTCPEGEPCTDNDTCTTDDTCDAGHVCVGTPRVLLYGDIVPPPDGNGKIDLDDILCTLDGFAGLNPCAQRGDIFPCNVDGKINLDDILAVLDTFAGFPPCPDPCPP